MSESGLPPGAVSPTEARTVLSVWMWTAGINQPWYLLLFPPDRPPALSSTPLKEVFHRHLLMSQPPPTSTLH